MPYVSANLNLLMDTVGGSIRLWIYDAGADAQTAVRVNNYFSDAYSKGARAKDIVIVSYNSFAASIHTFNSVTTTGADLTDGLAVASTDTD